MHSVTACLMRQLDLVPRSLGDERAARELPCRRRHVNGFESTAIQRHVDTDRTIGAGNAWDGDQKRALGKIGRYRLPDRIDIARLDLLRILEPEIERFAGIGNETFQIVGRGKATGKIGMKAITRPTHVVE